MLLFQSVAARRERPQRNFGREESDSVSLQRRPAGTAPDPAYSRGGTARRGGPTVPRYYACCRVAHGARALAATSLIASLQHPLYLCDNVSNRARIRKIRDAAEADSSLRSPTPRRRRLTAEISLPGNRYTFHFNDVQYQAAT